MITSKDFKEIFKLDSKCVIPKSTLSLFEKQIKGAYLLYQELSEIKNKKFKNVDGTPLCAYFKKDGGFQDFVNPLGSRSTFEIYYIDKSRGSTPFWTYTKYHKDEVASIKNSAYKIFEATILLRLKMKYSKYGINFEYRDFATTSDDYSRCHPNQGIWWDGIIFTPVFYTDENKHTKILSQYSIAGVITNRSNIWNGKILKPIQDIISNLKKADK